MAAALLAEAERLVGAKGHERAWPAVVAGDARARRFYERSGWADEGPHEHLAPSADGASKAIAVTVRRYVKRVSGGPEG